VAAAATGSPEVAGMVCVKSSTKTDHGGEEGATLRTACHTEGIPLRWNPRSHSMLVPHHGVLDRPARPALNHREYSNIPSPQLRRSPVARPALSKRGPGGHDICCPTISHLFCLDGDNRDVMPLRVRLSSWRETIVASSSSLSRQRNHYPRPQQTRWA